MNCKSYRLEIDELDFGAQPGAQARAHADACAACREFYEERARLRELVAGLESVGAPPDFEFRLKARIAAEEGGARKERALLRRLRVGPVAVLVAACVVLALAVTLRLLPSLSQDAVGERAANISAPVNSGAAGNVETHASATTTTTSAPVVSEINVPPDDPRASAPSKVVGQKASYARSRKHNEASKPALRQGTNLKEGSTRPAYESREMAVGAAENLKLSEPIPVTISAQAQPLKVVLRDEQGASRVVSIKPVSFGGEELVGRFVSAPRVRPTTREGVW